MGAVKFKTDTYMMSVRVHRRRRAAEDKALAEDKGSPCTRQGYYILLRAPAVVMDMPHPLGRRAQR